MFELLDRLVPENLTGGKNIAGTGITPDEKIGGIWSVERATAEILESNIPGVEENCEAAKLPENPCCSGGYF